MARPKKLPEMKLPKLGKKLEPGEFDWIGYLTSIRTELPIDITPSDGTGKIPGWTVYKGHAGFRCMITDGCQTSMVFLSGHVPINGGVQSLYCPACKRAVKVEYRYLWPFFKAHLEAVTSQEVADVGEAVIEEKEALEDAIRREQEELEKDLQKPVDDGSDS